MAVRQKGAISFALVYIPVELYTATQDNTIHFNQLSRKTKSRVRYKKVDESDGSELRSDDIVKAYQYDKNKYVVLSDEDFEKIKTEKDKSIQIVQFTDIKEISPVFYNRSYYILPQKGGEKAFELLRRAMSETGKVALGQTVMGMSETVVTLLPMENGIIAQTLYYADEVKEVPREVNQPEVGKAELDMAEKIIDSMDKPFQPEQFKNEYQEKLKDLIESKIEGREIELPRESGGENIINLMGALKASMEDLKGQQKPKRSSRKRRGA